MVHSSPANHSYIVLQYTSLRRLDISNVPPTRSGAWLVNQRRAKVAKRRVQGVTSRPSKYTPYISYRLVGISKKTRIYENINRFAWNPLINRERINSKMWCHSVHTAMLQLEGHERDLLNRERAATKDTCVWPLSVILGFARRYSFPLDAPGCSKRGSISDSD